MDRDDDATAGRRPGGPRAVWSGCIVGPDGQPLRPPRSYAWPAWLVASVLLASTLVPLLLACWWFW